MQLLNKASEKLLPPLYSQDGKGEDAIAVVKFFDPTGSWTWYATEGERTEDGDIKFFGYVDGHVGEFGYFTLNQLIHAKDGIGGLRGLPIERDRNFDETLAEVLARKRGGF